MTGPIRDADAYTDAADRLDRLPTRRWMAWCAVAAMLSALAAALVLSDPRWRLAGPAEMDPTDPCFMDNGGCEP